jgi:ribosomal subunit interface protein
MQLVVSGHHIEVTEGLRDHVAAKFEKLQRHIDHITNVEVLEQTCLRQQKMKTCTQPLMPLLINLTGKSSSTRKSSEAARR